MAKFKKAGKIVYQVFGWGMVVYLCWLFYKAYWYPSQGEVWNELISESSLYQTTHSDIHKEARKASAREYLEYFNQSGFRDSTTGLYYPLNLSHLNAATIAYLIKQTQDSIDCGFALRLAGACLESTEERRGFIAKHILQDSSDYWSEADDPGDKAYIFLTTTEKYFDIDGCVLAASETLRFMEEAEVSRYLSKHKFFKRLGSSTGVVSKNIEHLPIPILQAIVDNYKNKYSKLERITSFPGTTVESIEGVIERKQQGS